MVRHNKRVAHRAAWQMHGSTIRNIESKEPNPETNGEFEGNEYSSKIRLSHFPLLTLIYLWWYDDRLNFQYPFFMVAVEVVNHLAKQLQNRERKQLERGFARKPPMDEILEAEEFGNTFKEEKEFLAEIGPQLETANLRCIILEISSYLYVFYLAYYRIAISFVIFHCGFSVFIRAFIPMTHVYAQFVAPLPGIFAIISQFTGYLIAYMLPNLRNIYEIVLSFKYLMIAVFLTFLEFVFTEKFEYLYKIDRTVRGNIRSKFLDALRACDFY